MRDTVLGEWRAVVVGHSMTQIFDGVHASHDDACATLIARASMVSIWK